MYPSHLIFKHGYIVEWCRVFLCHLTQVGEKCCHVELEQRTVSLPAHSTNIDSSNSSPTSGEKQGSGMRLDIAKTSQFAKQYTNHKSTIC